MDDLAIIDRFTETFSRYIDSGFGLLAGDVAFLTSVLVAIDITLAGLFWAMHGDDNVPAQLIRKVLYVGFFALLLNNFKSLADVVFNSFAGLGLKATGVALTAADLMRPGFVAATGFTASKPLLEKAGELIGITSFFTNFVTIVVLMLAWLIVLLAFFVLAVQLFVTIIEFKLTTLAGFVLVPFALFGQTAFLAERVLGHVITAGIKLMVLAIVVGIGSSLFGTIIRPSGEITLTQAASTILAAIAVFGLAIFVPAIAAGLVSGAPQLGAGAAVATTAGLGGTAVAGGMLATGGARLAGRGAGGAIRSAASLTGTVGAAYESGGARGIAKATVGAPVSRMIAAATGPVRDAYREGAAAGYRATAPPPDAAAGRGSDAIASMGASPSAAPAWAQNLARRQRLTQAGMIASQALREGDRPASTSGPELKDKS
ncbi:MAG: P-type conjugative transfer protein TrbL [Hyphomicrobium sp.]